MLAASYDNPMQATAAKHFQEVEKGGAGAKQIVTKDSQAVTQPITSLAQRCLGIRS